MTHQDISLTTALETLHEQYVEAVNYAVAENRMELVASLAKEFDREAHALTGDPMRRAA